MKNITYICDRCGLEEKSYTCPTLWHTLTRSFSDGKTNVASTFGPYTYCPDCAEFIDELFDSFKVSHLTCGAIHVDRGLKQMECTRLRGHKGQHFSSLECWSWSEDHSAINDFTARATTAWRSGSYPPMAYPLPPAPPAPAPPIKAPEGIRATPLSEEEEQFWRKVYLPTVREFYQRYGPRWPFAPEKTAEQKKD